MASINNQNERKYLIHIIYAGTFLFAVVAIIGYLVWCKYEATAQKQMEKKKIVSCLVGASDDYNEGWAAACKQDAKEIQIELGDCIDSAKKRARFISSAGADDYTALAQVYVAQCKSAYGTPDSKSTCLLPNSMAKGLNAALQKQEKLCTIIS